MGRAGVEGELLLPAIPSWALLRPVEQACSCSYSSWG